MYIQSFHMDGFGIFSDVTVENLSPGLCIFLGANEAGKSTCLEFLRAMLTGWPAARSNEAKLVPGPLRGGQAGGGMTLRTDHAGVLRFTRRPGPNGGALTLTDEEGRPLEADLLRQALSGVSREVYRSVFGFSLSELENLNSLTGEGVRNALYGASFGPGLRSPGEALKLLDKQTEEIFKSGGSKPVLNQALRQLIELRQRKAALEQESAGYDGLALDLGQKQEVLIRLRQRKLALEAERRLLERRLGVWLQWNQWRLAGAALERMVPISPTFPENGPARLAGAQEARASCQRHLTAQREKLDRLRQRQAGITPDKALLEALPALRRLAERKSGFHQAQAALPAQEDALRRARADLALELSRLGPDWSCERIRATDRSLFAHEKLEKQISGLSAALAAHEAAENNLARTGDDLRAAQEQVSAARAGLAHLPEPPDLPEGEAREQARLDLARLREARRQLPARQQTAREARAALARACAPLRLTADSQPEAMEAPLDALLAQQEESLRLAARAREQARMAEDASREARMAGERADSLAARMDLLREEERRLTAPSREALDARTSALRVLRAHADALPRERQQLDDLDSRISGETPPPGIKNLPLLVTGLLLCAAGAAALLAFWHWGLASLPLAQGLRLELNLWTGGLLLLCGLGFLAGALPRKGPEALRREKDLAQWRVRREALATHMAALEEQARLCCQTLGLESMDMPRLEAAETLLERQREQCFLAEALRRDMEDLKQQADMARAEARRRESDDQEARDAAQQALELWQERMRALHPAHVPDPENATAFFARAESARLALGGALAAAAELHSLDDDLRRTEERLRGLPAVAERLPAGADDEALAEAVRQTLAACREADAARERRIRAEAALHNAQDEHGQASARHSEAGTARERAAERLKSAREQWEQSLRTLGLRAQLTPETLREALRHMDGCLAAEAATERARTELAQSRAEVAALRQPLEALLANLERAPLPQMDGRPDWLASLDATLEAAEDMARLLACLQSLEREATELEAELRSAEAALASAHKTEHSLLALAGAQDAEDFLRQATLHEERRSLTLRRQNLEEALRLAAGPTPLPGFLASFEEEDQEGQERRCAAITEELAALQEEEEELVKEVSGLRHKVEALSRTEHLSQLLQQEASLLENMDRMAREWSRRALARGILEAAKRNFERERQPEVIRLASGIFAAITGGRWRGISASLEDPSLCILPAQGEALAPENLSRGAREQAYLALRLAYIRNHAAHAAPLPVIMDEVLVNFDPPRAESAARAFMDLTTEEHGKAHQILYFTCQPHMVELLRGAVPQAALFYVEDGGIRAA